MDCEQFRQAICEDPASTDEALEKHECECEACAAYAARLRKAELLIHEAVRFDIAAVKQAAAGSPAPARTAYSAWSGLAAALIAAFGVWLGLELMRPASDAELVAAVLAHSGHEPESWASSDAGVSNAVLEDVLSGTASVDTARIGVVSYARSCWVAGEWLPHLVVQSEQGPVMILLLRGHELESAVPLNLPEQGLGGTLQPVAGGSIAVLGDDSQSLDPVEQRIAAAVNLTI